MSDKESQQLLTPVLRLRPTVPTELIRPAQRIKQPDGPWIAHPGLIDEEFTEEGRTNPNSEPGITMDTYRRRYKTQQEKLLKDLKDGSRGPEDCTIECVIEMVRSINMQNALAAGWTDHEIALSIEKHYVGAHQYLDPAFKTPPALVERFSADWGLNARGIYYRHYYSTGWVAADHKLWLPSLDGTDWMSSAEDTRRGRANVFLKHVLDNEKWNKSEYAWEADAWSDVFGLLRDDPVLAVDKHEYNTVREGRHPVSCLLTGQSKFLKRIPDATFGLATFKPRDYQSVLAEWDLDSDRLDALLLHRHCGLISDPRWGDTSLVFPFAVYEAKGWSGDAREARRQACSAAAVYLDMLDRLARQPGKVGEGGDGVYQTPQSHNNQVFVFTSVGAHWHILVGYKRPRLRREYAGLPGMSRSVYVFQRIWSRRVTTERQAWKLLSFIDHIHEWGATNFREFVIRHIRPWHEFGNKCYHNDVLQMGEKAWTGFEAVKHKHVFTIPRTCIDLPGWTQHFTEEACERFRQRLGVHISNARSTRQRYSSGHHCLMDPCRSLHAGETSRAEHMFKDHGYPVGSAEELVTHLRDIPGIGDAEIAKRIHEWETGNEALQMVNFAVHRTNPDDQPSRRGQKRRQEDAADGGGTAKRRRD